MHFLPYALILLLQITACIGQEGSRSTSISQLAHSLGISAALTIEALQPLPTSDSGGEKLYKTSQTCAILRILFNGTSQISDEIPIYLDSQSDAVLYSSRIQNEWSNNCWQKSSCVVSPSSTSDVSRILNVITATQTKFSVRSGGHDFNVNHSSVDSTGILIDLTNFNSINLSADKRNVTVGVGANWGTVYKALNGSGISINGGKSPNPGVGGQTLGGGHGWLSDSAGVTAAQVIAAEVVLSNGTVVQATDEHHPDLIWALRGGGPNFGIVTHFTYRTLPVDKVWFAMWRFAPSKNQQLVNALVPYYQLAANDTRAAIVFQLSVDTTTTGSFVGFMYSDPVEFPTVFAPFYAIEPDAVAIESTFGTIADLALAYYAPQFPDPGVSPSRDYVVSLPHLIDNETYQESYAAFEPLAKQALSLGWTMNYGSQAISQAGVKASVNTPLGLEPKQQDWTHVTMNWDTPEDDAAVKEVIHSMGRTIDEITLRHGSNLTYRFMNDAYSGQNVLRSYGTANNLKLSDISKKYDAAGTFQKLQNGGWLLDAEE